jgi:hypothetical protein
MPVLARETLAFLEDAGVCDALVLLLGMLGIGIGIGWRLSVM